MATEQQVKLLSDLTDEFFSPVCGNERKRQIEMILTELKISTSPSESVGYFLFSFLTPSVSPMVQMFTIQMLEDLVNQRWHLVPDEKRRLIRIALKDGLVKFHKSHESDFLIVKICKVIADIGRLELNLPEYFDFVKQLIVSNDKGMSCGLRLLKITLEEWAATNNSRCYLYSSTDAKKAMKLFAETQLSSIYAILTDFLYNVTADYKIHFAQLNLQRLPDSLSFSRRLTYRDVLELCANPQSDLFICPSIPAQMASMAILAFECLEKILPWSPVIDIFLASHGNNKEIDNLLAVILFYVTLGSQKFGTESSCDLVNAALQCLIEMLPVPYKVTEKLMEFSVNLFSASHLILMNLSKRLEKTFDISDTTSSFFDKFIEFQRLLMFHYFHRFFDTCQFLNDFRDAQQYLSSLLSFTAAQTQLDHFMAVLDVWQTFLDFLVVRKDHKEMRSNTESINGTGVTLANLRISILSGLVTGISEKILASINSKLIGNWVSLKDVICGENGLENDWTNFINTCGELVNKVAQFYPMETFQMFASAFDQRQQPYMSLSQLTQPICQLSSDDSKNLQILSIDMVALLEILGGLSEIFLQDETFQERREVCRSFVEKLSETISASQAAKLHCRNFSIDDETLKQCCRVIHSSLLMCLGSYSYWVAQSYADAQRTGDCNIGISRIISSSVDSCLALLSENPSQQLIDASVSCFRSFFTVVRPHYALSMQTVQNLYSRTCMTEDLPYTTEASNSLYCCLATYLVVPWYNAVDSEQEWSERKRLFTKLVQGRLDKINQLYKLSVELNTTATVGDVCHSLKVCLATLVPLLNAISEVVSNEGTKTKQIYHSVTKETSKQFLHLIQLYSTHGEILELLFSCINSLMKALIPQLESDFVEAVANTLMNMMQRHVSLTSTLWNDPAYCRTLTVTLKILQLIVVQPAKKFNYFFGSIVNMSCSLVESPTIRQTEDVELKEAFLELIQSIVDCHWRVFFPVAMSNSGGPESEMSSQFQALMMGYCIGIEDSQMSVAKLSLNSLAKLNTKWGLYKKKNFIEKSLPRVLEKLIVVLVKDSHPMLVDEICENLHAMVCATLPSVRLFQSCVIRTFEADQSLVDRLCAGLDTMTGDGGKITANVSDTDQSLLEYITSIGEDTDIHSFSSVIQELVRSQRLRSL